MPYTTDYEIYTPQLRSSTRQPLRTSPWLGNFTYEFDRRALEALGLNAVTFFFFILWERGLNGRMNTEVWLKKEISTASADPINLGDRNCFDRKFFADEPEDVIRSKNALFARYGLKPSYILIRDLRGSFTLCPQQKVAVRVVYDADTGRLKKETISLEDFQNLLVRNSNKELRIRKPFNYYETDLEKYLQIHSEETGALFPGDCDMLLYDQGSVCRAIVEFKKTTARDNTPLPDQSFLAHIDKDRNKYTRLNILRSYLSEKDGRTIPFVTVFYSVRGERQIKLELIGRDLTLVRSLVSDLGTDPVENQALILRKILEISL